MNECYRPNGGPHATNISLDKFKVNFARYRNLQPVDASPGLMEVSLKLRRVSTFETNVANSLGRVERCLYIDAQPKGPAEQRPVN